ncbi:MAG: hypothetical protein ACJ746_28130 [Bryobacteraceae bacterium]
MKYCAWIPFLSIFSPDAHTNIEKYLDFELSEFRALYAAADELGLSRGFDTREGTLEPTFKASLEKLDVLIKEHFTPEEISKLRDHDNGVSQRNRFATG